jgi:hypothetical protein
MSNCLNEKRPSSIQDSVIDIGDTQRSTRPSGPQARNGRCRPAAYLAAITTASPKYRVFVLS